MKPAHPASLDRVNLQHPNWSGRAYRSAREAFGFGLEWPGYSSHSKPTRADVLCVMCGVAMVVLFCFVGPTFFGTP